MEDFNLIAWILNALLIMLLAISGFWLKSLYGKVEKTEDKFINKELCDAKHVTVDERTEKTDHVLEKFETSMNDGFKRLYDKVDATNSIGDGLETIGEQIGEAIKVFAEKQD
jgi:hypothetical protein